MSDTNIFQGLDDVFNTKYEPEDSLSDINESKESERKKRKVPSLNNDKRDKSFVKEELLTLIDKGNRIMEMLEEEMKLGANPRFHETYASMMTTQMNALDRLRNLEIADREYDMRLRRLEMEKDKLDFDKDYKNRLLDSKLAQPQISFNQQIINSGGSSNNSTADIQPQAMVTTSDDVFRLIEQAKSKAKADAVKAEFEITPNKE
jgi:hypothetical protein